MGDISTATICNAATELLGRNLNLAVASFHKRSHVFLIPIGAQ